MFVLYCFNLKTKMAVSSGCGLTLERCKKKKLFYRNLLTDETVHEKSVYGAYSFFCRSDIL